MVQHLNIQIICVVIILLCPSQLFQGAANIVFDESI